MTKLIGRSAVLLGAALLGWTAAAGEIVKGASLPAFRGTDIAGQVVDLDVLMRSEERPYLLVVFLFQPGAGDDVANKLRVLHEKYGGNVLKCIALGVEQDRETLSAFAERMGIQYQILPSNTLDNSTWLEEVTTLPVTFFVEPNETRRIERVLAGGGTAKADLLKEIAENLFQQRREEALGVADLAITAGEDEKGAREIKGFYLSDVGRLDEAEAEFGAIGSDAGMAAIALARGDYSKAADTAQASEDPLARAILGEALLYQGKTEEANAALTRSVDALASTWKQARLSNVKGLAAQANGDPSAAISHYQASVALDGYNFVALSNEAATYQQRNDPGDLDKAQAALEQADALGGDPMVQTMLRQVLALQQKNSDTERGALVRQQIADLKARYEVLKAQGLEEPADSWTSRPRVLALLDGGDNKVVFPRAGTELLIQRELEAALAKAGVAQLVEREMLHPLLQELNLGASDLASQDTQRRLGRVLSAGHLAFLNYAITGAERRLFLRVVDTETTEVVYQSGFAVNPEDPAASVPLVLGALEKDFFATQPLQGLIAEVASDEEIIINLGKKHGLREGAPLEVLEEGKPVEVGGKVIAVRRRPVAKLQVTMLEADYAICTVTEKRDGTTLAKEMKVSSAK